MNSVVSAPVSHTPGPWKVQTPRGPQHAIDRKFEIVAPLDGGELVIVGEHTGIDCLKEANARLIAAAPDLLAACEYARYEQNKQGWISVECFARLTDAIAKARA